MSTTLDLDAIRARAQGAAERGRDGFFVTSLIEVAAEDVPALLAEIEGLRAEVERLRATVDAVRIVADGLRWLLDLPVI